METAQKLLSEMEDWIEPHIQERGWDYYQSGQVERVTYEGRWLQATVIGTYIYHVEIDIEDFEESTCDCPYDDYCKHIAAVVYYVSEHDDGLLDQAHISTSELEKRIHLLDEEAMRGILLQMIHSSPQVRRDLRLLLLEQDEWPLWEGEQWEEAIKRYEIEVPRLLQKWVQVIENYAPDDMDDRDRQDMRSCLRYMEKWCEALKSHLESGKWISAMAGWLVTARHVEMFSDQPFRDMYEESPIQTLKDYLFQCLEEQIELLYVEQDDQVVDLLRKMAEWILRHTDVFRSYPWLWLLGKCIVTLDDLYWVKKEILKWLPLGKREKSVADFSDEKEFISWWIALCLSLDEEEEALKAEKMLIRQDWKITWNFIRYYQGAKQYEQALIRLQSLMSSDFPFSKEQVYQEIIKTCQQLGKEEEAKQWRKMMLFAYPTLPLLKQCIQDTGKIMNQEEVRRWLDELRQSNADTVPLIDMYIWNGDWQEAMALLIQRYRTPDFLPSHLLAMLEESPERDVDQLLSLYATYAQYKIEQRHRRSYREAVQWLSRYEALCMETGRERVWEHYIHELIQNHRRLSALKDELIKAELI